MESWSDIVEAYREEPGRNHNPRMGQAGHVETVMRYALQVVKLRLGVCYQDTFQAARFPAGSNLPVNSYTAEVGVHLDEAKLETRPDGDTVEFHFRTILTGVQASCPTKVYYTILDGTEENLLHNNEEAAPPHHTAIMSVDQGSCDAALMLLVDIVITDAR